MTFFEKRKSRVPDPEVVEVAGDEPLQATDFEKPPPLPRRAVHAVTAEFACVCGKRWTKKGAESIPVGQSCPACGVLNRVRAIRVTDADAPADA